MKIITKIKKFIKKEKISRSWKKLYKDTFNELQNRNQHIEQLEDKIEKLESQLDQDVQAENIDRLEYCVSQLRISKREMREEGFRKDKIIKDLKEQLLEHKSNEIEYQSDQE